MVNKQFKIGVYRKRRLLYWFHDRGEFDGTLNYSVYLKSSCIDNTSYWFLPCLFGLQICYGIERRILGLPSIQHIYQYRGRIVEIGLNIGVIASIGAIIGCLYRFSDCDFFRSVLNYLFHFGLVYSWLEAGVCITISQTTRLYICSHCYYFV